ncbi:MAG: CAP64 protein product - [Tremellales sp. Tagirdzhanova-0007]|nr:MAG: CAP64 protein product - [Tremellales sp. Tagirdzhanova-0007]
MRSTNLRNFVLYLSLALNLGLLARWTVGPLRRVDISMQTRSLAALPSSLTAGFASLVGGRQEQVFCDLCSVAPELCKRFGAAWLKRAFVYEGTGSRLKRFLRKAARGEPFTVATIGGSVSKGFGLGAHNEPYADTNLNRVIFDHLVSLFPSEHGVSLGKEDKSRGKHSYINGALGGTGSPYFSLCFAEHIPLDTDLIIIELGFLPCPFQESRMGETWYVTLELQAKAAERRLQSITLYPSLRNLLLPQVLANNTLLDSFFVVHGTESGEGYSNVDLRHISPANHKLSGDLVNAYVDQTLCELDLDTDEDDVEPLPRLTLEDHWDPDTRRPTLNPQCFSTNSERNKLIPVTQNGWREWSWQAKNYLIANETGSKITFAFSTQMGKAELFYQRSSAYGLGSVHCWIDDEEDHKVRLDGYWDLQYHIGQYVFPFCG